MLHFVLIIFSMQDITDEPGMMWPFWLCCFGVGGLLALFIHDLFK